GNGVRAIATGWNSLAGDFDQLGVAIDNAQLALTAVELATDSQLTRIAMEQMEQHARVAKGIVQAAASAASVGGGLFLGNPIQAAADAVQATIDVETAQAQLAHLSDLEALVDKQQANDVAA